MKKIDGLLRSLPLAQKIGQLNQLTDTLKAREQLIRGGAVGSFIVNLPTAGEERRARLVELQRIAVKESKFGIPLLFARDVIHGYRTVGPIPLGLAASWDMKRIEQLARESARECSCDGIRWTFSPMLDIARDPRWGRVAEGAGEDPYLCAQVGRAFIRGYQGKSLGAPYHIAACAKHFVGYGAAESGRDYNTTSIPPHLLHNIYLVPFKHAVESGVATVMSSFNELNGVPMTQHEGLLTDLLRQNYGFNGAIVSDWNAVKELTNHRTVKNEGDAAVAALTAGVDIDMFAEIYLKHLAERVGSGELAEELVDAACRRVLELKEKLGLFARPYPPGKRSLAQAPLSTHRKTARAAAVDACVLLKNEAGCLPLAPSRKIALVGPLADERAALLGAWSLDGNPTDVVTVREGLRRALPKDILIPTLPTAAHLSDAALVDALQADTIVAVVGEHNSRSGETGSVSELRLPAGQEDLLQALKNTGKKLVVVVVAGRPLALEGVSQIADALLFVFHPGIEGGTAIADVLTGKESPGGRLPVSFPRVTGQVPLYYNHPSTGRPSRYGDRFTSRYCDVAFDALYPFGAGLSYTEFKLSPLALSSKRLDATGKIVVRTVIENLGKARSSTVVQLYLRDNVRSICPPVRELKGFQRVTLSPGQKRDLEFMITLKDLTFFHPEYGWVVEEGEHSLWVAFDALSGREARFKVVLSRSALRAAGEPEAVRHKRK